MGKMENKETKIRILPEHISNRIAAGEVVERPASVVKELVENAIDADANKITLVLKKSGKQLIQVIDNGCGMDEQNLQLAFERHATSKIISDRDLLAIETLGFRGEALPSIASVSQIEVKSRTEQDSVGNLLVMEGGNKKPLKKTACPAGTNISVKNIFFNTPARRNFMRSDNAELQQILAIMKRFFLAYPHIHFEVFADDNRIYQLPAGNIEQRVKNVFGEESFPHFIKLNESLGGIELSGFISKPDKVRRTRGNQFLFLNGRPIQDKALNHAVFQGYGNLVGPGEFPTYCLFLEMDPKLADINVHPTKMEVRFSNDRSLYYFFLTSVRKALNIPEVVPKMGAENPDTFMARFDRTEQETRDLAAEIKHSQKYMSRGAGQQLSLVYFGQEASADSGNVEQKRDETVPPVENDVEVRFWQIHNRYIVSEIKSGIVIIDQHVAHERILFERILRSLQQGEEIFGQQLLFPQTLELSPDDFLIYQELGTALDRIGFGIREFSGNTIIIDVIPSEVKVGREAQVLLDILDYYRESPERNFDANEKMAAAFSCKNAIKSGERLTQQQMHALVDQLFACESPYFCPHGRPVIITMDLEEFDRKFKRIT